MRLLVKVGGAQLEQPDARAQLAGAVASAVREAGHQVVLVHGGGNQIRALTGRLGIEDRYHDGLRVTDAATAEAVLMVLGGEVNRWLVHALQSAGVLAVGLTGADGATFSAAVHRPGGADLGYVGEVADVQPALVELLLGAGATPVVATVAPLAPSADGDPSRFYNINADMAAGPLAAALGADAVLFLTDVPGVLDDDGVLLGELTRDRCAQLRESGVIHGGMIPKVGAALDALDATPESCRVRIAPAAVEDALCDALEGRTGTLFRR